MINVTVTKQVEVIKGITIEGHSNYASKGKDIVCAGVSAIGVGTVNAIYEITKKQPSTIVEDGYMEIKFPADQTSQLIAKVMLVQLQSIEESYQKNLKITYSLQEVL